MCTHTLTVTSRIVQTCGPPVNCHRQNPRSVPPATALSANKHNVPVKLPVTPAIGCRLQASPLQHAQVNAREVITVGCQLPGERLKSLDSGSWFPSGPWSSWPAWQCKYNVYRQHHGILALAALIIPAYRRDLFFLANFPGKTMPHCWECSLKGQNLGQGSLVCFVLFFLGGRGVGWSCDQPVRKQCSTTQADYGQDAGKAAASLVTHAWCPWQQSVWDCCSPSGMDIYGDVDMFDSPGSARGQHGRTIVVSSATMYYVSVQHWPVSGHSIAIRC